MRVLLPLLAAVSFALGSICYKRAFAEGAGVAHAVVLNNIILAALFLPLLGLESRPVPWEHWYHPVLTALSFVVGHGLNVLSLRIGDVSVATPLLGAKVVFVGMLGCVVFGHPLTGGQWMAVVLATSGVVLMGLTDFGVGRGRAGGGRAGMTTVAALGCAGAFAFTDTMIQAWGGSFGVWSFLALQFGSLGLWSAMLLPWLGGVGSLRAPAEAWPWVVASIGLSGLQAILVTTSIAIWRDAAGVNVLYATRGLWSLVLVWFLGARLKNREGEQAGSKAMLLRLAGALLILGAVGLTLGTVSG